MKIRPLASITQFELLHRLKQADEADSEQLVGSSLSKEWSANKARTKEAPEGSAYAQGQTGAPRFVLSTCLRDLALVPVGNSEPMVSSSSSTERLFGLQAYERLLEVVCGLHSPLVGETEVFGQFKTAARDFEAEWLKSGRDDLATLGVYRSWFQALIEDTKRIRAQYLQEQGSQSYGSLARRLIREWQSETVILVGSGQLVQEIAPWLSKNGKVKLKLLARSMDRARDVATHLAARDPNLSLEVLKFAMADTTHQSEIASGPNELTVIVCAPIEAQRLVLYPGFRGAKINWIDLRAESGIDDLASKAIPQGLSVERAMGLRDFFHLVESSKQRAEELKQRASQAIRELAALRAEAAPQELNRSRSSNSTRS